MFVFTQRHLVTRVGMLVAASVAVVAVATSVGCSGREPGHGPALPSTDPALELIRPDPARYRDLAVVPSEFEPIVWLDPSLEDGQCYSVDAETLAGTRGEGLSAVAFVVQEQGRFRRRTLVAVDPAGTVVLYSDVATGRGPGGAPTSTSVMVDYRRDQSLLANGGPEERLSSGRGTDPERAGLGFPVQRGRAVLQRCASTLESRGRLPR